MANPFQRDDSIDDGPIVHTILSQSGKPVAEGLTERFSAHAYPGWKYELAHDPERPGGALNRALVAFPDGRVVVLFQEWQTWVQPIRPGLVARWVCYPPVDQIWSGNHDWFLWRYEGPGRLENVAPVDLVAGMSSPQNTGWIRGSYTNPPREQDDARGKIWIDGGGMPYGVERSDGWSPTRLPITWPWYWYNANFKSASDWSTDLTFDELVRGVRKGQEFTAGAHPGVYDQLTLGPDYFAAVVGLSFTDAQIKAMPPADVVRLYYGLGRWVMDDQCPVYESPRWPKPKSDPRQFAISSAVVEYQLRDRIYALRPDLQTIPLADGTTIPGLIPYTKFPPRDGLKCTRKGTTDVVSGYFDLAASILPGIGIWVSMIQYSNQLANMLEAAHNKGLVGAFVHDLTTGKTTLEAINPPGGTPAGGVGNTGKPAVSPLSLALLAAGLVLVAKS